VTREADSTMADGMAFPSYDELGCWVPYAPCDGIYPHRRILSFSEMEVIGCCLLVPLQLMHDAYKVPLTMTSMLHLENGTEYICIELIYSHILLESS
jgi:hypothetical protein